MDFGDFNKIVRCTCSVCVRACVCVHVCMQVSLFTLSLAVEADSCWLKRGKKQDSS